MARSRRYTVQVQRDEAGWWVASAVDVPGVHTQGRTLAQARERIKEALSAATGAVPVDIHEDLQLEHGLRDRLDAAVSARESADRLQREAQDAARAAVSEFARCGVSTRDAGELLRLSHQRVHQLLRAEGGAKRVKWGAGPKGRRK